MTISSTTVKNSYSGDGSTTTFNYTFKIFANSDLQVIIRSSTGTETVKTITTHYTVTGAGSASGGSITFTAGNIPTATETVVLRRAVPQTQAIDYIANDPFPAESHEEGLDRAMMTLQQVQEEVTRSIKLSRTNTMTSTEFTVGASARANKILAFDTNGELAVTQELGTFVGNWSASTTFNARDLVKDTTNNNIYLCNTTHTSSGSLPISTNTDSAKWDLIVDAASATSSATAAASSATAAAASASAAATSESNAATSESNASTSETNAASSASSASTSATNASNSATSASTSASNASTSETNASNSATAAASSATTAGTQATNASNYATAASTSATNAANSASAASTSASNASTSETNASNSASAASTSATNASNSATSAATSATAAQTAQAAAELALDNFDDVYLGGKASDPSVDNDGDPLTAGDLYFNTTTSQLKYWDGSSWLGIGVNTDETAKVSANDTTSGYLDGKLVAGSGITLTQNNDGSNETLSISAALVYPTISSISPDTITNAATNIVITGTNFVITPNVEIISTTGAIYYPNSVTRDSATQLTINATLTVDGTYFIRVENPDGLAVRSSTALLTVSDAPTWTTAAGSLGSVAAGSAGSFTVVATSDSAVTYSYTGSLPGGFTLNPSTGVISGTESGATAETNYNFTVTATDAESQTASRAFTITVTVGINNAGQFN